MKQKFLITILILAMLVLSACGGQASPPETGSEDAAATAVAQAWLFITQTAAAAPTSAPPTFTPQPTDTAAPTLALLPTLPPMPTMVAATPTQACEVIPQPEPKGALVNVEFYNESGGSANLAFGMNVPNDKSECYTYSFTLGNGDVYPTRVLAGCYWGYAWISGGETSVAQSGDKILCLTDGSLVYKILVSKEQVNFK